MQYASNCRVTTRRSRPGTVHRVSWSFRGGHGGILGTALTGVFSAEVFGGVGFAKGVTMSHQVMVQLTGIFVTALWCGIVTFILLKLVKAMVGLRVSAEQETEGLDTVLHNETGYNL